MDRYRNKKLLILGGASLHCKVVQTANEMGIYTIVTDHLPDSPAKKIARKSYNINVSDVEAIVEMCLAEKVDAVINVCLDFCQRYYFEICNRLSLPCFGTERQFQTLINKALFKEVCVKNGVDIIHSYTEQDIRETPVERIYFPLLVKPSDSRGSRGHSVCYSYEEVLDAIIVAKAESSDRGAIIEQYMGGCDDFQVTYLVIDREPVVVRTADRYVGSAEEKMDRVAIALSSPSKYTDFYIEKVHPHVVDIIKAIGLVNAPMFIQGFIDKDTIRFYDPGLRFPGGDYDILFGRLMGIDLMKLLIEMAFTSSISDRPDDLNSRVAYLNGSVIFTLHSTIKAGTIRELCPRENILCIDGVKHMSYRYEEGENIEFTGTVNQRIAEVNIMGADLDEVEKTIRNVQKELIVKDQTGENMIFCEFNTERLRERKEVS